MCLPISLYPSFLPSFSCSLPYWYRDTLQNVLLSNYAAISYDSVFTSLGGANSPTFPAYLVSVGDTSIIISNKCKPSPTQFVLVQLNCNIFPFSYPGFNVSYYTKISIICTPERISYKLRTDSNEIVNDSFSDSITCKFTLTWCLKIIQHIQI